MAQASQALIERADDVLSTTMATLGYPPETQLAVDDPDDVTSLIELALEMVVEQLEGSGEEPAATAALGRCLVALGRLQRETQACVESERLDALVNVHEGLARVGQLASVPEVVEEAAKELCLSGRFDRTIMFWLSDGRLRVAAVHAQDQADREHAAHAVHAGASLTPGLAETEVVRRRAVLLVGEGADDGRPSAWPQLRGGSAHVIAPLVSAGQVVGLVEADRQRSGRGLRRIDRDVCGAFAMGLGYALDRAVLNQRLQSQRTEFQRLVRATDAVIADFDDSRDWFRDTGHGPAAPMAATLLAPVSPRLETTLSAREIDVLEALASGATNAQIAARLFITEETVKSHVKRILRKLGASNRAEAVSRFLRLAGPADTPR
jgi:DNA-binding CsgD family transcriptional regulator